MNTPKLFVVVLVVILAAIVVGCGKGSQPTATPIPATNTPLPLTTNTPVPPPPTATPVPPTNTPVPPTPTPLPPPPTPMPAVRAPAMVSDLNCQDCHTDIHAQWSSGPHADTQAAVATELAEERSGESPAEVLHGEDAENCLACHGPTAVLAAGGMTEVQAMEHFFTTAEGSFSKDTVAINSDDWPSIACIACHHVPGGHPATLPTLFDSSQGDYVSLDRTSELCGQCHGTLRFPDTDHRTYDAWQISKHSKTQVDVASELAEEWAGQSPNDVINGEDAEDCLACHAPTAVLTKAGLSETQALEYFFTTKAGKFTADTAPIHDAEWPDISCTACHDPHDPAGQPAYFDPVTKQYESMHNTDELCGQCHGNLRFPDTDHLSYNILMGTGGIGVPDLQTEPDVICTDCHMFVSDEDGSNSAMFHGHSWAITVEEEGESTSSCIHCHPDEDPEKILAMIPRWQSEYKALATIADENVAAAVAAMKGVDDPALQTKLEEAQHNLQFAESDESNGFHNHKYLMSLLEDANDRALEILSALKS